MSKRPSQEGGRSGEARTMKDEPVTCRRLIFEGRVQGVGFRYTATSVARRIGTKGYVRNLRDGSVELVAEGTEQQIDRLLKELADAFEGCIEQQTAEEIPCSEEFAGFDIRL
jgi:acylphosphatase